MAVEGSLAPLLIAWIAGSFHFVILPAKIPATVVVADNINFGPKSIVDILFHNNIITQQLCAVKTELSKKEQI